MSPLPRTSRERPARLRPFARALPVVAGALLLAACGGGEPALCGADVTPVARVQSDGPVSPLVGETLRVRGVVTARFRSDQGRDGFFLQTLTPDDDAATAEALFVTAEARPAVGERVTVLGRVAEFGPAPASATGMMATEVARCGEAPLPEPEALSMEGALEPLENMRVSVPGVLTVVDVYGLGRDGQMRVARGGRVWQPTEIEPPGPAARQRAETNARRILQVDDGSDRRWPGTVPFLPSEVTLKTLPRVGDRLSGFTGVFDRRTFDRLHVQQRLTAESQVREPRFSPPAGAVNVASFNLRNYFNGDGLGGGFPTDRGARTVEALDRQEAKLVATVLGLGLPDVISLQELENDGFGPQSAVATLTEAINARIRAPRMRYDYVRGPDPRLGDDAIAVGLLYRADKVRPLGPPATLASEPFRNLSRPPLAQTFETVSDAERFTVVALHLKAKGCAEAEGPNEAQDDGQGCYNAARSAAVRDLLAWVAGDPTRSGDPDWLLIGDLNAYTREDPLRLLGEAGYENLVGRFQPPPTYTFVYQGAAGSLDHAFASPTFAAQARDARIWHINAPYSTWLDYRIDGKPGDLDHALYKASAVRASDHDPLVVSFR